MSDSENLVVVSKLKKYVKGKAGMNTSSSVASVLSEKIKELVDRAVENAQSDRRKTIMDRDFN